MEVAGDKVTNAAIAKQLGCNPSSVAQMRKRLASEGASKRCARAAVVSAARARS
jgi:Mn-dependent DtxR family transcriptional regulator